MNRFATLFVLQSLAACGGSSPATPDAAPDTPPPRCNPAAEFTAPVPIASLESANDDASLRMTPDELTAVFARRSGAGSGLYDLYTAQRTAIDAPFAAPILMASVNSVNSEVWPTLSPDGLLLVFQSDRGAAAGTYHPYTSKRASTDAAFSPPTFATALMDGDDHLYLANAHSLYFSSAARTGGPGARDLWYAPIDSTGATGSPNLVVGGVNTDVAEVTPVVSSDELRIYFRRTVGGELDVYTASRPTPVDPFGTATAVPALSLASLNEIPTWISPDDCALYVEIANAPGTAGGDDLYVSLRGQ